MSEARTRRRGADHPPRGPRHPACDLHDLALEQVVLGALLLSVELIDEAAERLRPDDFFEALHQDIFALACRLRAEGAKTVSPVTVWPQLRGHPALEAVGGAGYLAGLTANTPVLIGGRDYIVQLADMGHRRRLGWALQEALDALEQPAMDVAAAAVVARLDAEIERAGGGDQGVAVFTAAEAADRALAEIDAARAASGPVGVKVRHLPSLNGLTGGMKPGQLLILAGRPGMGKTALAMAMARGAAETGVGVLFVSLEMSDIELSERTFADLADTDDARVPHMAIVNAELNAPDWQRVADAAQRMARLPLAIADSGGLTLHRLRALVRRQRRAFEARGQTLGLVVVDYLQRLHGIDPRQSDYSRVSEISRGLKDMAKDEGVPVLALAQLSRQVESRDDKVPQLSDLRESGQIEQDADTVLFLLRPAYYLERNEPDLDDVKREKWLAMMERCRFDLRVICAKRRNGRVGTRILRYTPETQAIRERPDDDGRAGYAGSDAASGDGGDW